MCTKNKTFRPSNVSTYVTGTKVPDETPDLCSKIWTSFDDSKASEKLLFYLKMKHERQPLVLPKYVPCLGQDQVVRTSTGEKKGERLMAFTRPPPSQTRRAASLTFTSSKIPGLYEKIWSRFLLQISQIGTWIVSKQAGKELNHIAPCDSDSNTPSDIVKVCSRAALDHKIFYFYVRRSCALASLFLLCRIPEVSIWVKG